MTSNRTITELYQALRPLLLRDVAIATSGSRATGGMEAHALNSAWHTGQLAETQAPWAATKNEWATALATHAALPDVHHGQVTAGTLIALSGQQVSVAAGAAYQFIGTGNDTIPEWRNVSELAGNGLTAANGVLAVGVSGLGLSVVADAVALASSSNPGAAASVLASDASGFLSLVRLTTTDRLRTTLIDTASGGLTLDPAGDVVALAASTAIQTANYASQLTGWRATYAGEADFRYLFVDEMHAKSFIADLEQALAGGQIISKSVAVLAQAFTAPAAGGTATLIVRDLPSAPDMACFVSGDIVRLRQFSRASGALTIADCWGVVTTYTDNVDGTQSWTFTRSSAPNAGAMSAGATVAADAIVLDYGTTGNGYYEVNAIDGIYGANSPYSRIVTWTTHPAADSALRVQMGNLRGVYGYATAEYGIAMGDSVKANVTVDATNGVRLRQGTTDKIVLNPAGDSYFAGVMTIGTAGEIRQGTGTLGSNYTGLRIWRDSNVGLIGGYNSNALQWWGDTDGRLYAGAGNVLLSASGIRLLPSAYAWATVPPSTEISWHRTTFGGSPLASIGAGNIATLVEGLHFTLWNYLGTPSNSVVRFKFRDNAGAELGTVNLYSNSIYIGPNQVWHVGNDGSGSGLDADLLDGYQASAFAQLSGAAFTGNVTAYLDASGIATRFMVRTTGALATSTDNDYLAIWHITDNEMAIGAADSSAWRTLVLQPSGGTVDVRGYLQASSVGYDWSALTPGGGWGNYGSGNATFGVKRFGNLVSIKGVLSASGAIASNTSIYTLASEYRPSATRQFTCYGTPGAVRVVIASDGTVRPQSAFSTSDYLSIEITYFTGG